MAVFSWFGRLQLSAQVLLGKKIRISEVLSTSIFLSETMRKLSWVSMSRARLPISVLKREHGATTSGVFELPFRMKLGKDVFSFLLMKKYDICLEAPSACRQERLQVSIHSFIPIADSRVFKKSKMVGQSLNIFVYDLRWPTYIIMWHL